MLRLRYYEPYYKKEVHDAILSLLEEVKTRHGTPYEVVHLRHRKNEYSSDYVVDEKHAMEVYKKDFMSRKTILKARIGESIRRLLRSRSGGYFVAGTVAITQNGQVEWFANYIQPFKDYDGIPAVGFLKAVLDKGPPLLSQLCPEVEKGEPESKLLDVFVNSGVLKGKTEREVRVGKRMFEVEGAIFDWRKSIDLLYETDDEVWIIEGKLKLNYEALGEVLTYATLYSEEYAGKTIRLGIVCGMVDDEILLACAKYNVTVFEVVGNEVRPRTPR
jgi:hypothetical protein